MMFNPEFDPQALRDNMKLVNEADAYGLLMQDVWFTDTQRDQTSLPDKPMWHCGTAACFAGWKALSDGFVDLRIDGRDYMTLAHPDGRSLQTSEISEYARIAFGLTDAQAQTLFRWSNSIYRLRELVEEMVAEHSELRA